MSRIHLSKWPLWFAIAAVVLSFVLLGLMIPKFNSDGLLPLALVGYVLTPFSAAAALFWARSNDLKLQSNPLYLRLDGKAKIKLIGIVVGVSFIPAIGHMWYIATALGANFS